MPIFLYGNQPSMWTRSYLKQTQQSLQTTMERLASGRRINSADDDPGGIAISSNLEAQIRSFATAGRNGMNGMSMAETAEGSLGGISDSLGRMRELAMQAANGDLSATDRANLDAEYQELMQEVDRVIDTTEFNGTKLLDGATSSVDFQVGIDSTSDNVVSVSVGGVSTGTKGLDIAGSSVTSPKNAQAAMTKIDAAIQQVSNRRATFGAKINRLSTAVNNAQTMGINLAAAHGRIVDTDIAKEAANLARYQVLQESGMAMLAQANTMPQTVLSLLDGTGFGSFGGFGNSSR